MTLQPTSPALKISIFRRIYAGNGIGPFSFDPLIPVDVDDRLAEFGAGFSHKGYFQSGRQIGEQSRSRRGQ